MTKRQSGFTLVELIVVISVLGILSAIAIPRFISAQSDALTASGEGLKGAVNSAVALARAACKLQATACAAGSVSMDGTSVDVLSDGTPECTATTGIEAALASLQGYTYAEATCAAGAGTGTFTNTSDSSCTITYTTSTGLATGSC